MTTQALQDSILFQTGYLVNGIWKTLDTTFDVLNPATGEVVAKVAKAGKAETEEAIAAATKAFPAWRAKTAKERSTILYRWYELIIENKSWLGRLMTTEQGKPLKEAEGEVDYAASFIQWFAEQAKRSGISGVVASPQEAAMLREVLGPEGYIVTPGVRPAGSALGDQSRVATPKQAFENGASHIVIGRPITQAADPAAAFDAIVAELD